MRLHFTPARVPDGFILACLACVAALPFPGVDALAGRSGPVDVSPAPSWVRPVAEPGASRPEGTVPSGGSEYLLVDHQCDVRSMATYTHTVTRIVDVASFDQGPGLRIEYDPAYERLTVHFVRVRRSGESIDLLPRQQFRTIQREEGLDDDLYDARLTALLLMEDLRSGDTLDCAWTIAGQNPVFGGRYMESTSWAYSVPVRLRSVGLRVPEGRRIEAWSSPGIPRPDSVRRERMTEYRWTGVNIPAVTEDDGSPEWYDPYPELHFSEFHGWKDVADWARSVYEADRSTDPQLQSLAAALAAGRAGAEGFAAAAVQFVQDDIRYFGVEIGEDSHRPSSPATVLRRRFGDCKDKAVLLCGLLAAGSVRADPVLVNTYSGEKIDPRRPWPLAFDHVVVRVSLDGREYFIDPTASYQRGSLADRCIPQASKGLVVAAGQDTLVPIPAGCGAAPSTRYEERVLVLGDSALIEALTTYRGADADDARAWLAQASATEMREEGRRYYAGTYRGVRTLEPLRLVRDDTLANVLVVSERYAVDSFWSAPGAGRDREADVRSPAIVSALGPAPAAGRTAPWALAHPVNVSTLLRIVIPDGRDVDEDEVGIEDPAFRFRSTVRTAGDTIELGYEYASLSDHVPPEGIERYRANRNRAVESVGVVFGAGNGGGATAWIVAGATLIAAGTVVSIVRRNRRGMTAS